MNVCKNEIMDAIEAELIAANEKHPPFASLHEAYAVLLEEFEEADDELMSCNESLCKAWYNVKNDNIQAALDLLCKLKSSAECLAMEACQMAAMAIKAEQSIADKINLEG